MNLNRFIKKRPRYNLVIVLQTHHMMYKNSNSFVYKFVVNCQFFQITLSESDRTILITISITWTILLLQHFWFICHCAFNSADAYDVSNHRTISALPVLSKVLEWIMYEGVFDYMYKIKSLLNNQFGFQMHNRTCFTAVN